MAEKEEVPRVSELVLFSVIAPTFSGPTVVNRHCEYMPSSSCSMCSSVSELRDAALSSPFVESVFANLLLHEKGLLTPKSMLMRLSWSFLDIHRGAKTSVTAFGSKPTSKRVILRL